MCRTLDGIIHSMTYDQWNRLPSETVNASNSLKFKTQLNIHTHGSYGTNIAPFELVLVFHCSYEWNLYALTNYFIWFDILFN